MLQFQRKVRFVTVFVIALLLTSLLHDVAAQESNYEQLRFIRIGSQNDLYQLQNQSDKYFSVGTSLEIRHPLFNNTITQNLLFGIRNSQANEYGAEIDQLGFTPNNIARPSIRLADRPYAGLLYANLYRISSNLDKGLQIRSSIKIGVMGSASGMEQAQKLVHRVTGDEQPIGWESQIGNSLILDYTFKLTKTLPQNLSFLEVNVSGNAELGSVFNILGVGAEVKIGYINKFDLNGNFQSLKKNKKARTFQIYSFLQPQISYVIYDGTISGGLIPFQESPHVLPRSAAESSLFFFSYGLVAKYKNVMFRYKRVLRSDRFIAGDGFFKGDQFSWGEIDFIVLF